MSDDRRGRHRVGTGHLPRSAWALGVRIIVGLVAAGVVAVTGLAWSADVSGTSNALNAAGDVGVVAPSSVPGQRTGTTAASSAQVGTGTVESTTSAEPTPVIGNENILVVGADTRTDAEGNPLTKAQQRLIGVTLDGGGVNTDTILIVHIPAGGGRATGISIPRDTWMGPSIVDAPGVTGPDQQGQQVRYRPGKINGFYGTAKYYEKKYLATQGITGPAAERQSDEAGRTMLIKVVQQFTGIKITHYAEVNLMGFYLMSKAIGGVPVCLVHAVDDRRSGADFPAGHFKVQGKTALEFVRQRHGLRGGDLARIKRQQAFLESAANKILSVGTLTSPGKLAALVNAAHKSIVLDSGFDLFTFAAQMHGLLAGDIHFATIPTHVATQITTTDALAANPAQVRAIFAALAGNRPLPIGLNDTTHTTPPAASSLSGSSPARSTSSSSAPSASGMTSSRATADSATSSSSGGFQVPCVE